MAADFNFLTDYFGRKIRFFSACDKKVDGREIKHNYENLIFPAIQFPDEVYFFKNEYVNKYLKFYEEFYIVVAVNLLEFSMDEGVENKIIDWFIINESNQETFYNTRQLLKITKGGELIYKYTPPLSLND